MVKVADREIGPGEPCFFIAEAGVNHNGSAEKARQLIDAAVEAGADAVKFQTFRAEQVISPQAPKAKYQRQDTGDGESQLEMVRSLELTFKEFEDLHLYCKERSILFLSTPFDKESADFLDNLGLPLFKVGSGELTNLPFLRHLAAMAKPLIVSTGMSYLGEVETAVRTIKEAGDQEIILLHCVSNYPADPKDANLRAMYTMAAAFGLPVGYSDHTQGIEVPLAAVGLGACVIEKHFTLNRHLRGPDHRASLEPIELKALVMGIRKVEAALGDGRKQPVASEVNTAAVARRSLVATTDIAPGTILTQSLIDIRRPGNGLAPNLLPYVLGRTTREAISAGAVLTWEMIS